MAVTSHRGPGLFGLSLLMGLTEGYLVPRKIVCGQMSALLCGARKDEQLNSGPSTFFFFFF